MILSGLPCNVNSAGAGCFQGNVIPQGQDPSDGPVDDGHVAVAGSPLVGNSVTGGQYNYQFAGDTERLRRDQVLRVDWKSDL